MKGYALHVQHKDQDVFDSQNRVTPNNVVAVCTDTEDFRFGDGVTPWRELDAYGGGGDKANVPGEGYSGPLHLTFLSVEEHNGSSFVGNAAQRVPTPNELVVFPNSVALAFGDGLTPVGQLTQIEPGNFIANGADSLPVMRQMRAHKLDVGNATAYTTLNPVVPMGVIVVSNYGAFSLGNGQTHFTSLSAFEV